MKSRIIIAAALLFLVGCNPPYVWLDATRYNAKLDSQELNAYKGIDVYLEVYQWSSNADFWFYYSTTGSQRYTTHPSMNFYLDAVFRKSITAAGFTVYEAQPRTRVVPELRIYVNCLSDVQYGMEAQIILDKGIRFSKQYNVALPPPKAGTSNADLEKRAYAMMEALQKQLFKDPQFQTAIVNIRPIQVTQ
jgi:uncharacterized lipoprotein YajG